MTIAANFLVSFKSLMYLKNFQHKKKKKPETVRKLKNYLRPVLLLLHGHHLYVITRPTCTVNQQ